MRQSDLLPGDRLSSNQVTVVGVGAIGRQVALQLSAIGVGEIQLVDFDTVEEVNLAPQGYFEEDLGKAKVAATGDLCRKINSEIKITEIDGKFRSNMEVGNVLFCCVDSIDTRREIWEAVSTEVALFLDARMSAEVARVFAVRNEEDRKYYPTTLFGSDEAFAGSCTAKSTIYCANVAAGMMLAQFSKWLRRMPTDKDICLNLLSMDLVADVDAVAST